ncbi:oligopeptide transporter 1-like protein, partial [Trifolium pratense]
MAGIVEDTASSVHTKDHDESKLAIDDDDDKEVNDSPIEQVRLTVPITDDPTQPAL